MMDFIEILKSNVRNHPERIAVIDGKKKISYADFFSLVDLISYNLARVSCKPKIAFDLKQSVEAYALIIAILNIGGTYCPISPGPVDKKMQIIDDFEPDLIIMEDDAESLFEFKPKKITRVSNLLIKPSENTFFKPNYLEDDIIYIIYTSGSTGTPKGVRICRKALNKFLEWSIPTYEAGENDIWAQFSFLSFDLSVVDIFTCLCSGATLLVIDDNLKTLPSSAIDNEKISIWHSNPVAINAMMNREKSKPANLSSLNLMSFCGAPLTRSHVEFLFDKNPNLIIYNTYGPTEGTLFCTWQRITASDYEKHCTYTISLGKAIPGWNIYLQPTENTEEFEIIIYGEYIGKGYSKKVTDSGFKQLIINENRQDAFITGDIIYRKNDQIYFDGRKDRQVKINGNRIELAGIEYHLQNYLKSECSVVFHEEKLFCFVETTKKVNKDEIVKYLSTKLTNIEIPRIYYSIAKIPKTTNLKIDLEKLKTIIKNEGTY